MTQLLTVHPTHPQTRLIRVAAAVLRGGGVIAYPTDSSYALGCRIGDADAARRIRTLRGVDERHHLTLVCKDLAQIGRFARMDNWQFRTVRQGTPGSFTFLLRATDEVPRRVQHPKRSTIGVRVPDNPVVHALLAEIDEPILSSTLILPGEEHAAERCDRDRSAAGRAHRSYRRCRALSGVADHGRRSRRGPAGDRPPRAWRSGAFGACR